MGLSGVWLLTVSPRKRRRASSVSRTSRSELARARQFTYEHLLGAIPTAPLELPATSRSNVPNSATPAR